MLVSLSDTCVNSDDDDGGGADSTADIDDYEREVDENR